MLLFLITIAGGYFLYNYLLGPSVREYITLQQEIEHTTAALEQARKVVLGIAHEQDNLLLSKMALDEVKQHFAKEIRNGKLFVVLDKEAVNHNVRIITIAPHRPVTKDHYLELPIEMTVRGSYFDVLAYMQWLESDNHWGNPMEIHKFTIQSTSQSTSQSPSGDAAGEVDLILTLKIYADTMPTTEIKYQYLHNYQQNGGQ